MNEDVIADLKQFILATVSQATADLATKDELQAMSDRMATKEDIKEVTSKLDDLDLKLTIVADAHSELLEEHDKAINQLRQQMH